MVRSKKVEPIVSCVNCIYFNEIKHGNMKQFSLRITACCISKLALYVHKFVGHEGYTVDNNWFSRENRFP